MRYHPRRETKPMAEITCAGCKKIKPHRAKGLCIKCYDKIPRKLITCISCGERKPHEARQLCFHCYRRSRNDHPLLRASLGCVIAEEEDRRDSLRVPPLGPTMARPGSEEKILVLVARHARFETLYHPHDCIIPKEVTALTGVTSKRKDGGWHNNPSAIFHTPDLTADD